MNIHNPFIALVDRWQSSPSGWLVGFHSFPVLLAAPPFRVLGACIPPPFSPPRGEVFGLFGMPMPECKQAGAHEAEKMAHPWPNKTIGSFLLEDGMCMEPVS